MKKSFQTHTATNNLYSTTLDCVKPTQFSVIQTIHCNVGLKFFF